MKAETTVESAQSEKSGPLTAKRTLSYGVAFRNLLSGARIMDRSITNLILLIGWLTSSLIVAVLCTLIMAVASIGTIAFTGWNRIRTYWLLPVGWRSSRLAKLSTVIRTTCFRCLCGVAAQNWKSTTEFWNYLKETSQRIASSLKND